MTATAIDFGRARQAKERKARKRKPDEIQTGIVAPRIDALRNRLRQEWRYIQQVWVKPVRAYFDDAAIRERRRTAMVSRIGRENIKRSRHAAMTALGSHIAQTTQRGM